MESQVEITHRYIGEFKMYLTVPRVHDPAILPIYNYISVTNMAGFSYSEALQLLNQTLKSSGKFDNSENFKAHTASPDKYHKPFTVNVFAYEQMWGDFGTGIYKLKVVVALSGKVLREING
jgi:hypothetical protein